MDNDEIEPTAAPDPYRHPCVVSTDLVMSGMRMIVINVPKGDERGGMLFAETLGRDLNDGLTPILVLREGWDIGWFSPFEDDE